MRPIPEDGGQLWAWTALEEGDYTTSDADSHIEPDLAQPGYAADPFDIASDVDGDGANDLAVGAYDPEDYGARVHLFYGGEDLTGTLAKVDADAVYRLRYRALSCVRGMCESGGPCGPDMQW